MLATSISACVRSRAWMFCVGDVQCCSSSCPMSCPSSVQAAEISAFAEIRAHLSAKIGGVFQRLFAGGKAGHRRWRRYSSGGSPSASKAVRVTSSASVLSRPPLIPMTAFLQPMPSMRWHRPRACNCRISRQRCSRALPSARRHKGRGRYLGGKRQAEQREGGLADSV